MEGKGGRIMKYLILKQEIITGESKLVIRDKIETDDIELFCSEIINAMHCDRVLFWYQENN